MQIISHPSPNHAERRDGLLPELVVLHFTAMASSTAALERLCAPHHEVSAHYLISKHGKIYQLVEERRRAWHAGAGSWGGAGDINSRSIGIELDNDGSSPFSAAQMDALEPLLQAIMRRWNIPPEGIIAHSDIAPIRKADPGRRFDWRRLARTGLAVWPEKAEGGRPEPDAFLQAAERFGYGLEHGLTAVHNAFRLRFRPHATGPLDGMDVAMIISLTLDRESRRT